MKYLLYCNKMASEIQLQDLNCCLWELTCDVYFFLNFQLM